MARRVFVPFKNMTKQERRRVIRNNIIFSLFAAFMVLTYVFNDKIFNSADNGGIFDKVFKPTIICDIYRHIPNMINTIRIIIWALIIEKIIRFLMAKTFVKTKKGLTYAYMFFSMLRWILIIASILFILGTWGVDTTTLVASAGILTLVIGLGAQSLITDVLAGIFIVFEEVFEVGDIISFDGYRGTVTSIGIRTTEIEDAGGDIKYVNNSEIKQVINKSKKASVARCYINIDYSASIPEVEAILNDNLKEIGKNIKGVNGTPSYKGVSSLGESSVQLLIVAPCREKDVFQVTRDLNRAMKNLFDEHGIKIPFPQVVIHDPTKENK